MTIKRSRYSRREFIRLSAISLGTLAGSHLLSACAQVPTTEPASPTVAPNPAATPATSPTPIPSPVATQTASATVTPPSTPNLTAMPTATVISRPRPEIMKFFPAAPSKIVRTHHAGVWSNKKLVPGALRQMVDASITKLTGLNSAKDAWAALIKPGERIAIKVNAFSNSIIWTHVPLVQAVTDSLQSAGIPADLITIYDFQSTELSSAGFTVNTDQPGVRCTGMDDRYSADLTSVIDRKVQLADILKESDALINIPILKSHMMAGISFAMKNHYGSIMYPGLLHSGDMREVAALNAVPEIKDRTRLIIGDALSANLNYASSYPYWQEDWIGDSIFMSFDPVAHDTLGLKLLTDELAKTGSNPDYLIGMATPALKYAVELGLGTNDPAHMDVIEQTI